MKFKEKLEDGRTFIKLKSGEPISGVFRGEVHEFKIHWIDKRSFLCHGFDKCDLCKVHSEDQEKKSKFRFQANFIIKEENGLVAKVFESGPQVYGILRELNKEYPVEKHKVKITKTGEKFSTVYNVMPIKDGEVDAELEKRLILIPLNELGHIQELQPETIDETNEGTVPAMKEAVPPISDEDIPF